MRVSGLEQMPLASNAVDVYKRQLTCVGGMVRLEQGRLRQSVDIRYPAAMDGERLRAAL